MAISSLDPITFRRVAGTFATGVTVITVERDPGVVHGMTANSFTSVSLDPLLVLVCVSHEAKLLAYLRARRRFGVAILRAGQQALSEHFAKCDQSPEEDARLGIPYKWTSSGIPLLDGTLAELACNVAADHPAGDHTIFLGEVESMDFYEGDPLLFHRGQYRRLAP